MTKRKSPAFSFYPDSWVGGTSRLSYEEKGVYIDLLSDQWLNGPFTREVAFRICRGASEGAIESVLKSKFVLTDDVYSNARLEAERLKQAERSAAAKRAGIASGRTRKKKASLGTEVERNKQRDSNGARNGTKAVTNSSMPVAAPQESSDRTTLSPAMSQAFARWRRHRVEKFAPLGEIEAESQLMELSRVFDSDVERVAAIEYSISRGAKNLITNGDHRHRSQQNSRPRDKSILEMIP